MVKTYKDLRSCLEAATDFIKKAMRKRIDSEYETLDMHKTIRHSIQRGGAITFQYANLTQNQQLW